MRESGDMDGWLRFFLGAVRDQADDAVARARRLVAIREEYRAEAIKQRSSLARLAEVIVRNPVVTVRSVEVGLDLSNQGARDVIRAAVARDWLRSLGPHGRGGRERWHAPRVLAVMEAPTGDDDPTEP